MQTKPDSKSAPVAARASPFPGNLNNCVCNAEYFIVVVSLSVLVVV
jgi:hypothetical protein